MGLCYSRLRQCCGKIKQSPQSSEYRQVSQVVPPMELGDSALIESDSENSLEDGGWRKSKETPGNKARIGVVVDRLAQSSSLPLTTLASTTSNLSPTQTSGFSLSTTLPPPPSQPTQTSGFSPSITLPPPPSQPSPSEPPRTGGKPEKEVAPDVDFFSNMGMEISYAAPKRAVAKRVAKVEPPEPLKPSTAFTMDNLLPDAFVEAGGWGGDSSLEIDIPKEKTEKKTKKRPGFASAVEIDCDIDMDF